MYPSDMRQLLICSLVLRLIFLKIDDYNMDVAPLIPRSAKSYLYSLVLSNIPRWFMMIVVV